MIASSMASSSSSTSTSSLWSSSSTPLRKERTTLCAPLSACVIFHAKSQSFNSFRWNPQPGLSFFSSWNGLKRHLGVSIPKQYAKIEGKKGKCKRREGVYASLFGVGAPEALVIGVVALLVFGPKGLAEVARNLGKTLRAFQPTIRELQDVSREFKSTLEREIGLDDFQNPTQQQQKTIYTSSSNPNNSFDPNGVQAYSSEEYLKVTEEQLKASSSAQQQQQTDNTPTLQPNLSDPPTEAQNDPTQEAALVTPPPTQEPQT